MSERLEHIEGIFNQNKGKNVVFDEMQRKLSEGEIERVKFISSVKGEIHIHSIVREHIL